MEINIFGEKLTILFKDHTSYGSMNNCTNTMTFDTHFVNKGQAKDYDIKDIYEFMKGFIRHELGHFHLHVRGLSSDKLDNTNKLTNYDREELFVALYEYHIKDFVEIERVSEIIFKEYKKYLVKED